LHGIPDKTGSWDTIKQRRGEESRAEQKRIGVILDFPSI
jgi:hypothetical protein